MKSLMAPTELMALVEQAEGFQEVLAALKAGHSGSIDGTWGSSCALVAATLAKYCPGTLVVVLPRISEVDDFAMDLQTFRGDGKNSLIFPAWESLPAEHRVSDMIFGGRIRCLEELEQQSASGERRCVVTSIPALLQPVPDQQVRKAGQKLLKVGETIDLDELTNWLVSRGFERVTGIERPGEFTLRGGILDIFPTNALDPIRIELFGDEIDSIRQFDVETQRKIAELKQTTLSVIMPSREQEQTAHLMDSLPVGSWVVLAELQDLIGEGKHYLERLEHPKGLFHVDTVMKRLIQIPSVTMAAIGGRLRKPPVT